MFKPKVIVYDSGSAFCVKVDGIVVDAFNTLADAWNRIAWIYRVAQQDFVVGQNEIPAKEWLEGAIKMGFLDENVGLKK